MLYARTLLLRKYRNQNNGSSAESLVARLLYCRLMAFLCAHVQKLLDCRHGSTGPQSSSCNSEAVETRTRIKNSEKFLKLSSRLRTASVTPSSEAAETRDSDDFLLAARGSSVRVSPFSSFSRPPPRNFSVSLSVSLSLPPSLSLFSSSLMTRVH